MNQVYFGKTGDEDIEIWYEEGRQMWEGFVLLISMVKLEVKKNLSQFSLNIIKALILVQTQWLPSKCLESDGLLICTVVLIGVCSPV